MEVVRLNPINTAVNKDYSKNANDKVTNMDVQSKDSAMENPVDKKDAKMEPEQLKTAVDTANSMFFKNNTHLKFEIHDKTKQVMVRIVSDDTGEVVKEIPPEKMLDMVAKVWETLGILVDEKR